MKIGDLLNNERVQTLGVDKNAYPNMMNNNVNTQHAEKVLFPEAYENASHYYNKNEFTTPSPPEPPQQCEQPKHSCNHNSMPTFDIKSLLPMLMGGNFNDMLKPLMSMFGGGKGGMDMAKIFEMFKPKSKPKREEKKEEDISSKFDDMIIIED